MDLEGSSGEEDEGGWRSQLGSLDNNNAGGGGGGGGGVSDKGGSGVNDDELTVVPKLPKVTTTRTTMRTSKGSGRSGGADTKTITKSGITTSIREKNFLSAATRKRMERNLNQRKVRAGLEGGKGKDGNDVFITG